MGPLIRLGWRVRFDFELVLDGTCTVIWKKQPPTAAAILGFQISMLLICGVLINGDIAGEKKGEGE